MKKRYIAIIIAAAVLMVLSPFIIMLSVYFYASARFQYHLAAGLFTKNEDYQSIAMLFLFNSADKGYPPAQFLRGKLYHTSKYYDDALVWLELSAENGHEEAQFSLGEIYANADGVEQNFAKAALLYQKSADQGNAAAQYNLGLLKIKGALGKPNIMEGCFWLYLAAKDKQYDPFYCDEKLTADQKKSLTDSINDVSYYEREKKPSVKSFIFSIDNTFE
jgi:TPR repeat protein